MFIVNRYLGFSVLAVIVSVIDVCIDETEHITKFEISYYFAALFQFTIMI